MNYLDKVNSTPVPIELFMAVASAVHELPEDERRSLDGPAIAALKVISEMFPNKDTRASNLLASVTWRIEALAKASRSDLYHAWSKKTKNPDMDLLHPSLVEAACVQPLLEENPQELGFDLQKLFDKALEITNAETPKN